MKMKRLFSYEKGAACFKRHGFIAYILRIMIAQGNAMERFYFETPDITRKEDALAYVTEFDEYGSEINGTGGLQRYQGNYAGWLKKLDADAKRMPDEERVPARTYFLVRESDRKIVGMCNIRLALNERLRRYGGHIGYSIRPTDRGKGYNNINLYLALKVCAAHGIENVFLDADLDNPASWKTMEAFGGKRIREYYDDIYAHCTVVDYVIDVRKAIESHQEYENVLWQKETNGGNEDAGSPEEKV